MLLDIVILPPPKLRQKLGQKIKHAVKEYPYIFVVDNHKLIPHLSLFHIRTFKSRYQKLVSLVQQVIKSYRPFKLSSKGQDAYSPGIVHCLISKPLMLQRLHAEMVEKCRSLRTGPVPWQYARRPTKLERYYFKKYGSRHLLKFFNPHFTAAKLRNPDDGQRATRRMKVRKFSFLADTVAICEVNRWLQVTKILKTFKLK